MIIDYFTVSNSEITATFSIESVQRSHGYASGYTQVETWILREGDRVIRTSYGRGIKKMEKDFQKIKDNALSKGYIVIEPNGTIRKETKEETKQEINNPVIETIQETKEETIDNTTVKTVKEVKPKNKVAKLQAKLTCLNAQLSITKGNRNKAKLVLEILRIESAIEQLIPEEKEITLTREQEKSLNALTGGKFIFSKLTQESKKELLKIVNELESLEREEYRDSCTGKGLWKKPSEASTKRSEQRSNKRRLLRQRVEQLEPIQEKPVKIKKEIKQSKPVDAPVTKKDEFCKKPEKATIKFLESKFKDAQIEITDKQVILKSETSELKLNCFVEIPYIDEYYNHYRRKKLIKRLRDGQTSKAHSVCEYIGSILLAA